MAATVGPTPSSDAALAETHETHAIILGAGASGLAAATLLARDHGMRCTVYERFAADGMAQEDEESYPIGVNPRGMKVLKMVDPALEKAIDITDYGKIAGWTIREPKKEIAKLASGTVVGTTRGKVVGELYKVACATEGVEIKLGHKMLRADVAKKELVFSHDGAEVVVDYSAGGKVVLDCTGCFSKMRTAVADQDAEGAFECEAWPWDISFRCLFTAPKPPQVNLDPRQHYIFTTAGIYAAVLTGSRWVFSLSINPALIPDSEWMLSNKATPELIAKLKAHIEEHIPQASGMLDESEYAKFFERRSFTGQVVRLGQLHHKGKVGFLGDAAHAVIPSTGEGINSALEDVSVLLAALVGGDGGGGSVDGWLERYSAARIDDARAISTYALYLLEGMKAEAGERNRRTASMVLSLIGQKMKVFGPTWNDKSFGKLAERCERYSVILEEWRKQMSKVEPWGNRLIWYFAKDGGRKQVKAARKAEKKMMMAGGGGGGGGGEGAAVGA